jgi:hypothetical protein
MTDVWGDLVLAPAALAVTSPFNLVLITVALLFTVVLFLAVLIWALCALDRWSGDCPSDRPDLDTTRLKEPSS